MRQTRNMTRKMKNSILAIPAAAAAIPPNPKIAAMIAMIKKISAHRSIANSPCNRATFPGDAGGGRLRLLRGDYAKLTMLVSPEVAPLNLNSGAGVAGLGTA